MRPRLLMPCALSTALGTSPLKVHQCWLSHGCTQAWRWPAGTPEAQGKAELLMAVISSMNRWQGYTVGASRMVSHVAGSLSKHRKIIHEVRSTWWHACRALHLLRHLCSPLLQGEGCGKDSQALSKLQQHKTSQVMPCWLLSGLTRVACKSVVMDPWLQGSEWFRHCGAGAQWAEPQ